MIKYCPYKIKFTYSDYGKTETTNLDLAWSKPEFAIHNIEAIKQYEKYKSLLRYYWNDKNKLEEIHSSYRGKWWYRDDLAEGLYIESEEGDLVYTNSIWADQFKNLISIHLILDYEYYF